MKVLILGGYGNFGGRLARLLADEERLTLLIAGRDRAKADAFIGGLQAKAKLESFLFDRGGDVEAQLRAAAPDIVVDASGPFQVYGDNPYRVVKAAIANGVHYLDLADGAAFVEGVRAFDAEARERDLFVISGASTTPALTGAAFRALRTRLHRVDRYSGGIAPSPHAEIGVNVYRAIASYAGKRVRLRRDGGDAEAYALIDARNFTIAPPGYLPLHRRRFSLIEVPDLNLFSRMAPSLRDTWFGAGTVPELLHRMLNVAASLVRWRLLPSLALFGKLFHRVTHMARFGEDRGGLFVCVEGTDESGGEVEYSWHLVAEGDDGPFIPAMASEVLIRKCLAQNIPASGARSAESVLTLEDQAASFEKRSIHAGFRARRWPAAEPVFEQILGPAYSRLPQAVRAFHGRQGDFKVHGRAAIDRGRNPLSKLIAVILGFPEAAEDVPVTVEVTATPAGEIWRRTFGEKSFQSELKAGAERFEYLLQERFGPLRFGIALVVEADRLRWVMRRATFLGLTLPEFFLPRGEVFESGAADDFYFYVEIALPLIGLIVRYRGTLDLR